MTKTEALKKLNSHKPLVDLEFEVALGKKQLLDNIITFLNNPSTEEQLSQHNIQAIETVLNRVLNKF